jgi:hypothetical protein
MKNMRENVQRAKSGKAASGTPAKPSQDKPSHYQQGASNEAKTHHLLL